MNTPLLLGAHMPIAGGLHKAVERICSLDGTAMQIFTRNQRQWKTPALRPEDIDAFAAARKRWGDWPVAAHDSYLVNLAGPDPETQRKSVAAMAMELQRCEALAIPWLVTHPGAPKDDGPDTGLRRYAANLDAAVEVSGTQHVCILLENTAGQGSVLGHSFEQLATILEKSAFPARLGVCFDTCHAHAAGYDLAGEQGYDNVFKRFDAVIGLDRLCFFHLNDAKNERGSRVDRHEHIGQGAIGEHFFACLLQDARFAQVPKVIETPKGKNLAEDVMNLALLRRLAGKADPSR